MATIEYEILRQPSKDYDQILQLILDSIESSPWKGEKISLPHVKMTLHFFLDTVDIARRVVILARQGDEIVGVIGGMIARQPVLGMSCASELMWYVKPACRKKLVAKTLLEMFEAWANNNDAQYITLSHYVNELGETVGELYKKRGFKPMEVSYIKELK